MCHDLPPTVMVLAWARAFLILIPEVFPATPRGLRRTLPYSDTVLAEHVHFWLWSPKYFLPRLVFCDELGRIVLAQINVGHRFSYHLQRIKDSSRPALLRDQCRFTQYPSLIFCSEFFSKGNRGRILNREDRRRARSLQCTRPPTVQARWSEWQKRQQ